MIKNLKLLRQKSSLSQQQLAEIIGVSQQSINKYENHTVEPDIATLISLSDFFKVSVDFLIGNTEVKEKADNILDQELTPDEFKFLAGYRQINETEREIINLIIKNSK